MKAVDYFKMVGFVQNCPGYLSLKGLWTANALLNSEAILKIFFFAKVDFPSTICYQISTQPFVEVALHIR